MKNTNNNTNLRYISAADSGARHARAARAARASADRGSMAVGRDRPAPSFKYRRNTFTRAYMCEEGRDAVHCEEHRLGSAAARIMEAADGFDRPWEDFLFTALRGGMRPSRLNYLSIEDTSKRKETLAVALS